MLSLLCEMHALDTETRQGVRGRMKKGIIDYYDEAEAEELECFVFLLFQLPSRLLCLQLPLLSTLLQLPEAPESSLLSCFVLQFLQCRPT